MEELKDGDIAPIIDDGSLDGTPSEPMGNQEVQVEEPKTSISKEKFEEIDKARKVFYEENKRLKKELESLKGVKTESSPTLEVIKIAKKLEKFSEEEINSVSNMIKSENPRDILNALDNPIIKSGIERERLKVAKENQTPSPSQAGSLTFNKKITSETSKEEAQRIIEERFKNQTKQDSVY